MALRRVYSSLSGVGGRGFTPEELAGFNPTPFEGAGTPLDPYLKVSREGGQVSATVMPYPMPRAQLAPDPSGGIITKGVLSIGRDSERGFSGTGLAAAQKAHAGVRGELPIPGYTGVNLYTGFGTYMPIVTTKQDIRNQSQGWSPGYQSYNESAFDGPYLRTKYDMGGTPQTRTFGVDYPYDTASYGGLRTGENASQFFDRAMTHNVMFDRADEMPSSYTAPRPVNVSFIFGRTGSIGYSSGARTFKF
jgi:hypothetical protein